MNKFISLAELENSLEKIKQSPTQAGNVVQIVIRPEVDERQVVNIGKLTLAEGLVGDNWKRRGYKKSSDGRAHPEMQINIMNSRVIAAIAGEHLSSALAGDQFYVDFNLSKANLPPGTRLSIGTAELEVTSELHLACKKFSVRFGKDATKFVNSDIGQALNLRGINAKVIVPGTVAAGASIKKLA